MAFNEYTDIKVCMGDGFLFSHNAEGESVLLYYI